MVRLASRPRGAILRGFALFVIGNLVGVLVTQFIPTAKTDRGETLYLIGFLLLVAVIIFALIEVGQQQGSHLVSIDAKLAETVAKIGDITELHTDTSGDAKGRHFEHLADVVNATHPGQEICALTFYGRKTDSRIPFGPYADARTRYMSALLNAVKRGVTYRRLICFEGYDTAQRLRVELIPAYTLEHCRTMLALQREYPKHVFLKKAPAVLTADLLVVAHRLGAISVERLEEQDRHYGGAIVVYDPPNGRIVNQLYDWWNEAHEKSAPVALEELSPEESPAEAPA